MVSTVWKLRAYTRVCVGALLRLARFPFDVYASVLTDLIDIAEGRPERLLSAPSRAYNRITERPYRHAPVKALPFEFMGTPQFLLAGGTTLSVGEEGELRFLP